MTAHAILSALSDALGATWELCLGRLHADLPGGHWIRLAIDFGAARRGEFVISSVFLGSDCQGEDLDPAVATAILAPRAAELLAMWGENCDSGRKFMAALC